jgi:uncharacterized protein YecT (DUF1311 family)
MMRLNVKSIWTCVVMASFYLTSAQAANQDARATNKETQDSDGYSQTYVTCIKSADDNVLHADACMSDELKHQDARLNKVYKDLLGSLGSDARDALVKSEKIWVQLKLEDAHFESLLYGENTQIGNAQLLKNDLFRTAARAQVLEKYLKFSQL